MTLRPARIAGSASPDRATPAPPRATATTSAKLSGPAPAMTVSIVLWSPAAGAAGRTGSGAGAPRVPVAQREEPADPLPAADPQSLVLPLVGHPGPQPAHGRRRAQRQG